MFGIIYQAAESKYVLFQTLLSSTSIPPGPRPVWENGEVKKHCHVVAHKHYFYKITCTLYWQWTHERHPHLKRTQSVPQSYTGKTDHSSHSHRSYLILPCLWWFFLPPLFFDLLFFLLLPGYSFVAWESVLTLGLGNYREGGGETSFCPLKSQRPTSSKRWHFISWVGSRRWRPE